MSERPGPVVIGGLRGSGTRVAARLVRELGFFLGGGLNDAMDNQYFGFLLGDRPEWYRANLAQAPIALRYFENAFHGRELDAAEASFVREAVGEWSERFAHVAPDVSGKRVKRLRQRVQDLRSANRIPADASGWGWKSPATHIFLEELADAFPRMKYVYVVRDGLDLMSKAKTQREAKLWGRLFGIDSPDGSGRAQPDAVLRYWDRANRRALRLGPRLFGERFLALRYDFVCADPRRAAAEVGEFLDVRLSHSASEAFSAFVSPPPAEPPRRA
jgi:hypothetical protein